MLSNHKHLRTDGIAAARHLGAVPGGFHSSPTTGSLLDQTYRKLRNSSHEPEEARCALEQLFLGLEDRKRNSSPESWAEHVKRCRAHVLKDLLHEDPFTARAFQKPRGYAGDAVLMDYIYGREERWPAPHCSGVGRAVFDYTTMAPASAGVRARRGFIADFVDRLAEAKTQPKILSVAAGHLREAELIAAVRRRRLGRLIALDSDHRSLREVERCYTGYGVETVHAGFRDLIRNRLDLSGLDAVYTTGLFDYLGQPSGRRLVQTMFAMLNPGGRLVVANFLPEVRDVGYMEVYMDWNLIYRSRQDMLDLTAEIPMRQMRRIEIFAEENQNIIFLEVTRN